MQDQASTIIDVSNVMCLASIDTDTAQMIPHTIPIPSYNDVTAVRQAISGIIHIIKNSEKFWQGDKIQQAFEQLAEALLQHDTISTVAVPLPIKTNLIKNDQPALEPISKPTTFRPVTLTIEPQPTSITITLPQLSSPTLTHPMIPQIPLNFPTSVPKVSPEPRVIHPRPCYTHTAQTWHPTLALNLICQQSSYTVNHIFDENGRRQTVDNLIIGKMS